MAFAFTKYVVKTSAALGAGAAYSAHFRVGETLVMALWGLLTTLFFVPTLRKNGALMTVFGSLALTFFLLAGGQWSPAVMKAAGYVGAFCGSSAIYLAIAEIYQEALGLTLPGLRPIHLL
jgi:succinate-acetate transporter protein